jgi:hypothetical protein
VDGARGLGSGDLFAFACLDIQDHRDHLVIEISAGLWQGLEIVPHGVVETLLGQRSLLPADIGLSGYRGHGEHAHRLRSCCFAHDMYLRSELDRLLVLEQKRYHRVTLGDADQLWGDATAGNVRAHNLLVS